MANTPNPIQRYIVKPEQTIRDVVKVIDQTKDGIALVVNSQGHLIGAITDGDIRRYLISNQALDVACEKIMTKDPVRVDTKASKREIKEKLSRHRLRNIPVVDPAGKPVSVVDIRDLIEDKSETIAVVMAGGEGQRLRPITDSIPKPMIRVGDKPILERILNCLTQSGIKKVYISVNYQAHVIMDHFKDGKAFGLEIEYLKEPTKLGTAGALSMLPTTPSSPFVVMNGDVMTNVNIDALLEFHQRHRAALTVAAAEYKIHVPYGVLNLAGHFVLGVEEKPTQRFLCNAGIYILDPELLRYVPKNSVYNMTELMDTVIRDGLPLSAFPIHEYWVDIGKTEELEKAKKDAESGLFEIPSPSHD